ncbi:MAG TPA: hypothetical protein PK156_24335, partial [Polyangium sp.]|nr:hypothetical protein [Polyangium sp.]
ARNRAIANPPTPAPGVDDDLPAYLRNTARNRAIANPPTPAPGVDDDLPAHLRNTARTRALQAPPPAPIVEGARKNPSSGIPFGMAVVSMLITLIAGLIAGWIIHSRMVGTSPLDLSPPTVLKR